MTNFSSEWIKKARQAKSAEELLALAGENGVEMTAEEAAAYYAKLNPAPGELADEELDNVAGGGCGGDRNDFQWPKVGDLVRLRKSKHYCPSCNADHVYVEMRGNLATKQINRSYTLRCANCGKVYEIIAPVDSFTIL